MTNERTEFLLNSCIEYLAELWDRDDGGDWSFHWKDIIGMTDKEMKKYDLEREV